MREQGLRRRSVRLPKHDYAAGAYFITIVTAGRVALLGSIERGEMLTSPMGDIARREWFRTAQLRPYVQLRDDCFVVMPDHIHGIIWLAEPVATHPVGAHGRVPLHGHVPPHNVSAHRVPQPTPTRAFGQRAAHTIPNIVAQYKAAVTHAARAITGNPTLVVWQRGYHEHIIRDEKDLQTKRAYIQANIAHWGTSEQDP